jgi:hypothetical protein
MILQLFNPYAAPPDEVIPAKIWELLRRNRCFQRTFNRLRDLHRRQRFCGPWKTGTWPHDVGLRLVECVEKKNRFAAVALRWLVPDPKLEVRYLVKRPGEDTSFVRAVSIGAEWEEDLTLKWFSFKSQGRFDALTIARRTHGGRHWGPHLIYRESSDPGFQDTVNDVQEWLDYVQVNRRMDCTTPWSDTPAAFKRAFCYEWRQIDALAVNPIAGARVDGPMADEIDFFEDFDLIDLIARGAATTDVMTRAALAGDYRKRRVFIIPKVTTRGAARVAADCVYALLCEGLPRRESEILGTGRQWKIFLCVEQFLHEGQNLIEALRNCFRELYFPDFWSNESVQDEERKQWQKRESEWHAEYRVLDAELSRTGFVQRIFPCNIDSLVCVDHQ